MNLPIQNVSQVSLDGKKVSKKIYVANITHIPEDEKPFLKSKTCLLSISVGQEAHEAEKFKATLQMVNRYFKKCTVVVGDTLQRHTIAIDSDKTADELYDLSKQLGDEWLSRNVPMMEEALQIPYEITRWDDWMNYGKFPEKFEIIKQLYESNEMYKEAVNHTIGEFLTRYKQRNPDLPESQIINNSRNYLLEECACMLQWFEKEYDYEIYPSQRTQAIGLSFAFAEHEKSLRMLKLAKVRFDKVEPENTNIDKMTLDGILKVLPCHIYWKNKYGVYLGGSLKQARSYKLQTSEALLNKTDFDFLDNDAAIQVRKNDLEVMRLNNAKITQESADIDGESKTFLSYKSALKDKNGQAYGVLGVSVDITSQKTAERKLRESNEKLKKAIDAKNNFLNNISHEIKTPLSCILKMSSILYEDWEKYPNNQSRKAHLKMAIEGNKRLQQVLERLLDLTKTQSGKMQYNKELYYFDQSVQNVVSEFMDSQDKIRLHFEESTHFALIYDHFRIEQVIRNLLDNALTYGSDSEVDIRLFYRDEFFYFSITDQGIGVPDDEKKDIFQIFTQSSRTRGTGGTGIGLSVAKTIIQDHGGSIWVENNQDTPGSTFIFKIPIEDKQALCKAIGANDSTYDPTKYWHTSKPVLLLIDDDSAVLTVSKLVFQRMGFEVIVSNTSQEGLEKLKQYANKIDVVLLDMMLPDITGLETLKLIKADSSISNIPVYIHSGINTTHEINSALALGAAAFIDKTSSIEEIEKLLGRFFMSRAA